MSWRFFEGGVFAGDGSAGTCVMDVYVDVCGDGYGEELDGVLAVYSQILSIDLTLSKSLSFEYISFILFFFIVRNVSASTKSMLCSSTSFRAVRKSSHVVLSLFMVRYELAAVRKVLTSFFRLLYSSQSTTSWMTARLVAVSSPFSILLRILCEIL